jgi:hypothetical protein
MVFASSAISVEKKRVGPGVAEVPEKLGEWGAKHVLVALILTVIRARSMKRLMAWASCLQSEK